MFKEGKNEFAFTLPATKKDITFKILTHKDDMDIEKEIKGLQKINKESNPEMTTRLKYIIISVDGVTDRGGVRKFVDE